MLDVLYRDEALVVVNKESGILVHRSLLDRHETRFAMQEVRDQIGAHVYPVHRLDKPTSGALVFALTPEVARRLGEEFAGGRVEKRYLAIVRGVPKWQSLLLDYPLKEEIDLKADQMATLNKPPQEAQTDFLKLGECEIPERVDRYPTSRYSLIEARPRTGRRHQIRRHLRHLGHPIVGDVTYGVGKHNRFFGTRFGIRRLLLACTEISFVHPLTGKVLSVKAPLAEDMRTIMQELGWGAHARS